MTLLVGQKAPDFTAPAVLGNGEIIDNFNLHAHIKDKYAAIVFYPLDFTFVCPSELIALDHRVAALKERGVEVMTVSIDSHFTHNAWKSTPIDQGGIGQVQYTMVGDMNHNIVKAYGVEHPEAGVAFRGTVIIDDEGVVRHQLINDLPIGRNMDELVRIVDAIQFHQKHGEVCPAGWQKGDAGMKADTNGVAEYLSENSTNL